ncbi:hypothetical protein F4782DRAFT_360278 [Xylaria castorea]|nr:hypothetical protein F4782DRAFT_360278 [Xylaria castorea]
MAPRTVNNAKSFLFCAWIRFIIAYYSSTAGEEKSFSLDFSSSPLRCLGCILYSPAPMKERQRKRCIRASTMSQVNEERSFCALILVNLPVLLWSEYTESNYAFHYFSFVIRPHLVIGTRSSSPLCLALPRDLSGDYSFSSYQPLHFTISL